MKSLVSTIALVCLSYSLQVPASAGDGPYLILHDYFDATGSDLPPIPSVIQANQAYLGTTPFDGVAVAVTDSTGTKALSVKVMNNVLLDDNLLASILAPMNNLPGAPNLTQNFALVFIDRPADFFDDWTNTIENFGKLAKACKLNGLKGIIFDNEQYLGHIGDYPNDVSYPTKTLPEYIAQAQLRGKQIMERMVLEYPDITVLTFFGDWISEPNMPAPLFPSWWSANELIGPFFVGFAQGMGSLTTHVDGGELYNLRSKTDFSDSYNWRKYNIATDSLNSANIPPALRPAWPNLVTIGFGVADRTLAGTNLDTATIQPLISNALQYADKYVWWYPEQFTYLKSPASGGAPQAWVDAIRQGKNTGLSQRQILGNTAPIVTAGPNASITLPAAANLIGTATDDGLPNNILITNWTLLSGPAPVVFGNASALTTTASFAAPGTYILRLSASDGTLSSSADVTITVSAANTAPVVNAGPNIAITLPSTASLSGTVTDDGLPNGTIFVTWSLVSGPGSVSFANASAFSTTVSFTTAGSYVLRLTASDGALSSSANVTVTVNGANTAPVVSATSSPSVTLPALANLSGTATDDGLPNGVLTQTWSVASGPGPVTFGNASALNTTASFTVAGNYTLRLTASDGVLSSAATVSITVSAGNTAPVVNAGPDVTVILPSVANLTGTATDNTLPNGPLKTTWSVSSGPGPVIFGNASSLQTSASFTVAGTYVLTLTATDGALSSSSNVSITVQKANAAPVVSAVSNLAVTLPAAANLSGTATDDGLPNGTLTTTWKMVSGPGPVVFGNPSALSTTASFNTPGAYVLSLTASDGALSSTATISVAVSSQATTAPPTAPPPANTAPVVTTGQNQTIVLPSGATLTGTVSDDGLPNGTVSTSWSQVSGPAPATFGSGSSATTTMAFNTLSSSPVTVTAPVSFPVAGTYVLRLTASDGSLSSSASVTVVVNPPPAAPTPAPASVDLKILSPAPGATLSGSQLISTAVSSNVVRAEFSIDNVVRGTVLTSPFNFTLDTTTIGNGSHTLTVVAYDALWNMKIVSLTVNVKNTKRK